jgi:hypothetical protein
MPPALPIEFQQQPGCLIAVLKGRAVVENKPATFRAIAGELEARHLEAVLVDMRPVPGLLTFMDRFQLGVLAGHYLAGYALAALARPEQLDPGRIGQLVAKNRGADVQLFHDPVDADAWVRKQAPKH